MTNSEASPPKNKFVRKSKPRKAAPEKAPEPVSSFDEDVELDELLTSIREHADGVFIPKDENETLLDVKDWIPMPKPIQDLMGTKGLPCGLITMAYGKKDCGKTTFATEALISAQREGGIAILLDTEHKYSIKRAVGMGLDRKRLIIIRADTIEEAFHKFTLTIGLIKSAIEYMATKPVKIKGKSFAIGEIVPAKFVEGLDAKMKKSLQISPKYANKKICCVWDSLGATPSKAELDPKVKDFSMTAAKIIKGELRKTLYYIRDTRVAFVIINQVYANMNVFGKQTTPYGGSGPEYHSAIILEFAKLGHIRPPGVKASDGPFCGIKTQIECVKNHMAQPFKKVTVEIDWRGFVVERTAEYAPEEEENERTIGEASELPGAEEDGATQEAAHE